jgi:hypothetical protein
VFYLPNVHALFLCISETTCWKDGPMSPSDVETTALDFTIDMSVSEQERHKFFSSQSVLEG